jgi:hypothetical protein
VSWLRRWGRAFGTPWTAFWYVTLAMVYHDLRVTKEGVDIDQIAAVFD